MKNNFLQRVIAGILLIAIIVGCMPYNPLAFRTLFVTASALTMCEFDHLVNQSGEIAINRTVTVLEGAYLFPALMGLCIDAADSKVSIPYLILLIYLMVSELHLKKKDPVLNWVYSMLSQMHIVLPFVLLNVFALRSDPETTNVSYNPILPLSIFAFLWPNGTGTYCFDFLFGRYCLFERISPKKSWEGSISGGIVAIAALFAFTYFFPIMTWAEWVGSVPVIAIFGTWGDLTESLSKRQLQIKSFGSILPEHGGMLDHLDSLPIAIPAGVVYLYVLTLF